MTKKNIPTNIEKYPHKFLEHVRWGDTDGYQHVNNVSISRYFESARVNIIRELESKKFSFVMVNFTINYFSQIFYPNKIKELFYNNNLKLCLTFYPWKIIID